MGEAERKENGLATERSPHVVAAWRRAFLYGLVVAGLGVVAGGLALVREGVGLARVAEWVTLAAALTAATAMGARRIGEFVGRASSARAAEREVLVRLEEEAERRRQASERLALIGRLAAGVGHEINNPLSAVKGNLACALEELERLDAAPAAREALAEALTATERIAWITADMRALTADVRGPLGACAVEPTLQDALRYAADRLGGAKVVLDVEPRLPRVRTEPRLLAEAIGRLAAQAAGSGRLRSASAPPTVRITARSAPGAVEIAIDDEGPRIPAHVLPTVFEPFAPHAELLAAGLNLALPLTRELAERGGGRVEATWHERGNRFILTLAAAGE